MGITAPIAAEGAAKGAEGAGAAGGADASLLGGLGGAKGAGTAAAGAGADVLAPAAADAAGTGLTAGSLDALSATGNLAGTVAPGVTGIGADAAATAPALAGALDQAPAAASAGTFGAPTGVTAPLGADPTAALGAGAGDATLPAGATTISANGPDLAFSGGADPVADLGGANPAAINPAGQSLTAAGQLGAAAPTTPSGASGGFLDTLGQSLSPSNLASGIGNSIAKNPLGALLGAGGLGYNVWKGQQQTGDVKALEAQAGQQAAVGSQLEGYLTSGTLPPGLQAGITQAVAGEKAKAISNAASQGLSTDPIKNTALASELANIDAQVPILTAQIGQQLMTAGVSASGLSSNIYEMLANLDATQTANLGKSIANMAAALSGKTNIPGTNLNIGG